MPNLRLQAMDAQRFDPSLRRMRSIISLDTTLSRPISPSQASDDSSHASSPIPPAVSGPWALDVADILPNEDSSDSANTSETEDFVSPTPDLPTSRATSPTYTSEGSITLEGDETSGDVKELIQSDKSVTFIPSKNSNKVVRRVFSRSLSRDDPLRTDKPRYISPLAVVLSPLGCLPSAGTVAFEESFRYELQREEQGPVQVHVVQKQTVHKSRPSTRG